MSTDAGEPRLPAPSVLVALLRPAREVVNRLLAMDPDAAGRLQALSGRALEVHLTGLSLPLRLEFHEQGVELTVADEADEADGPSADATLRAAPGSLATLALSNGQRGGRELEFRGDVGVIHEVRALFSELDIDWEEQLSRVTGDVVAHQVGNAVRGTRDWLRHAGETFLTNAGEYLTEERRSLPTATEVEAFLADVDRVRQATDRLRARIRRLQQQAGGEG